MKMKIYLYMALAAVALGSVSCVQEKLQMETPSVNVPQMPADAVAGELLVKFDPRVSEILDNILPATKSSPATRSGLIAVDDVLDLVGTYQIERVFPKNRKTEEKTRESELHLWYVIRYSDKFTGAEVAERLSGLGEVQQVEFNREIKRSYNARPVYVNKANMPKAPAHDNTLRNDVLFGYQWYLDNIGDTDTFKDRVAAGADVGVKEAWEKCMGSQSIVVAVLDEGVCIDHPDLAQNIWVNPDEEYGSYEDHDGNGYAGDRHGYNFIDEIGKINFNNYLDSGHGTHVAGVIAAVNDNGIGISSIAGGTTAYPGVKIMSCQIFSGDKATTSLKQVRAIKYAADNGAHIIQCSWGYMSGKANLFDWGMQGYISDEDWTTGVPIEKSTLEYFIHNAGGPNGVLDGGIAIFAAGNEAAPMAGYPGAYKDYISVAATAPDFTPSSYSNYGYGVNISAPGGDPNYYLDLAAEWAASDPGMPKGGNYASILSTLPPMVGNGEYVMGSDNEAYGYMEGTSMACPQVTGVVALGLSYAAQQRKHFTASEFRELVLKAAVPIGDTWKKTKNYYPNGNPTALKQMLLNDYKGQMGNGQIDAGKLLELIDGNDVGRPMTFPNVVVAVDASAEFDAYTYFAADAYEFKISVENTQVAIATAGINGKVTITGRNAGTTKAKITAKTDSETVEHNFVITVRNTVNGDGWL